MQSMPKFVFLLIVILQVLSYQRDKADSKLPSLMPPVKELSYGEENIIVDHCNLKFEHSDLINTPSLIGLKKSFLKLKFNGKCEENSQQVEAGALKKIEIYIEDAEAIPLSETLMDTDESYSLRVSTDGIHISARQYSGVPRALATLAQLIKKSAKGIFEIRKLPISINDSARYPFRGLMVDTSRSYYDPEILKEVIHSMALAKFNVFHWHITDDDSFPLNLESRPSITENGAFQEDQVYTREIIQDIVDYATSWGVRVIPEFDNPGHTRSIGMDPSLNYLSLCFNSDLPYTLSNAYKIRGGCPTAVVDPSYAESYDVVEGIINDLISYFPGDLIHLGGDEVYQYCFEENPNIQEFMSQIGASTYDEMVSYFISEIRARVSKSHPTKQAIYWSNEDTFNFSYKDGDILMYWGYSSSIQTLKELYPNQYIVLSPADSYYLDCGFGNKYGGKSWCDPYKTYWNIYENDPETILDDPAVLGGEVPMWSELSDGWNIHSKLWPRAASMADLYWNDRVENVDLIPLVDRLTAFGDLLNEIDIPTSPITNRWCKINSDFCFAPHEENLSKD